MLLFYKIAPRQRIKLIDGLVDLPTEWLVDWLHACIVEILMMIGLLIFSESYLYRTNILCPPL